MPHNLDGCETCTPRLVLTSGFGMKFAIPVLSATAVIFRVSGATVQSKSAPPAATAKAAGNSTSTGKAHAASSHSAHSRSRHSKARRASAPSYQTQPTPERYQEIQKALADRGYFKGEVNGQWGPDSIDALQRFQTDQQIPNDGKLNSLSLSGLGLGPKHDAGPVPQSAPTAPAGSAPPPSPPPPAETPDQPAPSVLPVPPK